MKLKTHTVKFIKSSDIFKAICEHFKLDYNNFAGEFSKTCTSVSYGNASNTIICPDEFIEILESMGNFAEADLKEIATWFPQGIEVDLEN